jgi:hypothetical protein
MRRRRIYLKRAEMRLVFFCDCILDCNCRIIKKEFGSIRCLQKVFKHMCEDNGTEADVYLYYP